MTDCRLWLCLPLVIAARSEREADALYRRHYGYAADDAFSPPVALDVGRRAFAAGKRWRSGDDIPSGVLGEGLAMREPRRRNRGCGREYVP